MKTLTRVLAVLAAVACAAPALACSDMMQQTTADNAVQKPAVAKAQTRAQKATKATKTAASKSGAELAKAQLPKQAQN
jgi:hypothetical protein